MLPLSIALIFFGFLGTLVATLIPNRRGIYVSLSLLTMLAGVAHQVVADRERSSGVWFGVLDSRASSLGCALDRVFRQEMWPTVEIGRSNTTFNRTEFIDQRFFSFFEDSEVTVTIECGRPLVTARFIDPSGVVLADIDRNEWKVNQGAAFDRKFDDRALEVKDSRGDIAIQVEALDDRVRLQARLFGRDGTGVYLGEDPARPGGGALMEITGFANQTLEFKLQPLIRYPSELHPGERLR